LLFLVGQALAPGLVRELERVPELGRVLELGRELVWVLALGLVQELEPGLVPGQHSQRLINSPASLSFRRLLYFSSSLSPPIRILELSCVKIFSVESYHLLNCILFATLSISRMSDNVGDRYFP